jgi:excinuclease UvrABC ATPase subunit
MKCSACGLPYEEQYEEISGHLVPTCFCHQCDGCGLRCNEDSNLVLHAGTDELVAKLGDSAKACDPCWTYATKHGCFPTPKTVGKKKRRQAKK